jgi:DNA-directed RNA polymerase omega subunit
MEYLELEKLIGRSENSIYKLVVLASKRALEIAEGQPKLVSASPGATPSAIALSEIAAGKVYCRKAKAKE